MNWDLDELLDDKFYNELRVIEGSKNLYRLSFIIYYLIGNVYYNSVLYTRNNILQTIGDEYHEFTTSKKLYDMIGLSGISFKVRDAKYIDDLWTWNVFPLSEILDFETSVYSSYSSSNFDADLLYDITFYGNTDILIFSDPFSNDYIKFVLLEPARRLIENREYNNYYNWSSLLRDNVYFNDLKTFINNSILFNDYIYAENLSALNNFLKDLNEDEKFSNICIYNCTDFFNKFDSQIILNNLCRYFNSISLYLDKYFSKRSIDEFKNYLYLIQTYKSKICFNYDSSSKIDRKHLNVIKKLGFKVEMNKSLDIF